MARVIAVTFPATRESAAEELAAACPGCSYVIYSLPLYNFQEKLFEK